MCSTPRPSRSSGAFDSSLSSTLGLSDVKERQRKREKTLRRSLEEGRTSLLRVLARVAAASVGEHLPSATEVGKKNKVVESSKKASQLAEAVDCKDWAKTVGIGAYDEAKRTGPIPFIELWATERGCNLAFLDPLRELGGRLPPGSLIRYAFESDSEEWIWYVGVVQSDFTKGDWYKAIFEDGEQLWVRLDSDSMGRLWSIIERSSIGQETERFEHNIDLVIPGSSDHLRTSIKSAARSLAGRSTAQRLKRERYLRAKFARPGAEKKKQLIAIFAPSNKRTIDIAGQHITHLGLAALER